MCSYPCVAADLASQGGPLASCTLQGMAVGIADMVVAVLHMAAMVLAAMAMPMLLKATEVTALAPVQMLCNVCGRAALPGYGFRVCLFGHLHMCTLRRQTEQCPDVAAAAYGNSGGGYSSAWD